MVIDGGFSSAYHKETGIAGYTLVYHSRGFQLVQHEPFTSAADAIQKGLDIRSTTYIIEMSHRRMLVADTDIGSELKRQIVERERRKIRGGVTNFKRVGCTRYQHRQPTLLYKFQNCRSVRTAFPSQLLVQILLAVLHNNALVSIVHALSGNVVSRSVNVLVNGNVVNTRSYAVDRIDVVAAVHLKLFIELN